eukprot:gb/GEZN01019850.1/.p1 GENE.gb/GEZN01019850.1/~~gb/GEZN01019850.1/.p1  ORF type:complete len:220 (-),score=38.19 gb/GEZN01019850.1/:44-664(-)
MVADNADQEIVLDVSSPRCHVLDVPTEQTIGGLKRRILQLDRPGHNDTRIRCVFLKFVRGDERTMLTPLQDLSRDDKTLQQYGITQDVWIILKKKMLNVLEVQDALDSLKVNNNSTGNTKAPGSDLTQDADSKTILDVSEAVTEEKKMMKDRTDNASCLSACGRDEEVERESGRKRRADEDSSNDTSTSTGLSNEDFRAMYNLHKR